MSEHVLIVSDVSTRPLEFDRWQASCSCGFIGNVVPEDLADEQAHAHRRAFEIATEVAAAVAAEREACAKLADPPPGISGARLGTRMGIAAAIRARGDK